MSEKSPQPEFDHSEASKAPPYPSDASRELPREVMDDIGYGYPDEMKDAPEEVETPAITDIDAYAQVIAARGGLKALDKASQRLRDKGEHESATALKNTFIYISLSKEQLDR